MQGKAFHRTVLRFSSKDRLEQKVRKKMSDNTAMEHELRVRHGIAMWVYTKVLTSLIFVIQP